MQIRVCMMMGWGFAIVLIKITTKLNSSRPTLARFCLTLDYIGTGIMNHSLISVNSCPNCDLLLISLNIFISMLVFYLFRSSLPALLLKDLSQCRLCESVGISTACNFLNWTSGSLLELHGCNWLQAFACTICISKKWVNLTNLPVNSSTLTWKK